MSDIDTAQNDVGVEPNLSLDSVSQHEVDSSGVPQQNIISSTGIEIGNNGEHVTAVVTKAKRAAAFLWTLLHAQVCRLSSWFSISRSTRITFQINSFFDFCELS
jgi:hypothetical protein